MNFKRIIRATVASLALFAGSAAALAVEPGEEPIITFHTTIYEKADVENVFHIVLGATESTFVDVDFGYGPIEEEVQQAVFNPDTQQIDGTFISCSVSKAGIVKIYGDPKLIDYVYMEGCYIDEISFPQLTEVSILNLEHNELKALDLSHMTKLQALYISDNPFNESPLIVGASKPQLTILEMSMLGNLDPAFSITGYPNLVSMVAYSVPSLRRIDPTGCPELMQLSVDATSIQTIDVTKNPKLLILNLSQTNVTSVDLSKNLYLTEFYCSNNGSYNTSTKFGSLDLSKNTELKRLFCAGNNLKELDLSNNPKLTDLSAGDNLLPAINLDANTALYNVNISKNFMDFATLPAPRNTYSEYYYYQWPMEVDKSYKEGAQIDFSSRVLRTNSITTAKLFSVNRQNPSEAVEMDAEYYTYANGKITLNKATSDSLYVAFYNTMFMDAPLTTSNFMVKTAEEFGKPSPVVTINFSSAATNVEMSVGIAGATQENPVTFYVDFGNGQMTEFEATGASIPETPNVKGRRAGNATVVYLPEGKQMTAFGVSKGRISGSDFSQAMQLTELVINGTSMSTIDLKWNNLLRYLNLDNNSLTALDLSGGNGRYEKNLLTDISAANNKIATVILNPHEAIRTLDLSKNQLSELLLEQTFNLVQMNVADNRLTAIDLNDCESLTTLDCSHNNLTSLPVPTYCPLSDLNITYNDVTFAQLAPAGSYEKYLYAPQNVVQLPTKAPSVNLRSYVFTDDKGQSTTFVWRTVDGDRIVTDTQISADKGFFKFIDTEIGEVYCSMTHPAFPDFEGQNIYKTSQVLAADMPKNVFASFTTTSSGVAELSLAGKTNGTVIYIDWKGDGNLDQYILNSTYKIYRANTTAGADVKCYSYDEEDNMTVFSVSNVNASKLDVSKMKQLINFSWYNGNLGGAEVNYPQTATLEEFVLNGTNITQVPDLSKYTNLKMLNMSGNKIESIDVSTVPSLQLLFAASNEINEVKLNNPRLWNLALESNKLAAIDLSGVPALQQLSLGNNNLSTLNLDGLSGLRTIYVSSNNLTIETLPLPKDSWYVYDYKNQKPLDVQVTDEKTVDLSSQLSRGGEATQYFWYVGSPWYDDYGDLTGEELYVDEEYTIENGVTTFKIDIDGIMCVMANPLFPDLYLYTNLLDVRGSGIEEITVDDVDAQAEYYNLNGIRVANPGPGIYICRKGDKATKVLIK